jgi:hypothetical protein
MTSLAEKEAMKGKVQCIYMDPPYGIKFNSNWQPSTKSRDVKDSSAESLSREPEMIRAFRDTWKDSIHSYLSYLRDRLIVARYLLAESGSVFVQIGEENVHLVRALMQEIFGERNFITQIAVSKTGGATSVFIPTTIDYIIWFAKDRDTARYQSLFSIKNLGGEGAEKYNRIRLNDLSLRTISADERHGSELPPDARVYRQDNLTSQSVGREKGEGAASWFPIEIEGRTIRPNQSPCSQPTWVPVMHGSHLLVLCATCGRKFDQPAHVFDLFQERTRCRGSAFRAREARPALCSSLTPPSFLRITGPPPGDLPLGALRVHARLPLSSGSVLIDVRAAILKLSVEFAMAFHQTGRRGSSDADHVRHRR